MESLVPARCAASRRSYAAGWARGLHRFCTELVVYLFQPEVLLRPTTLLELAGLPHVALSSKPLYTLDLKH